jgi:hypothetical protein
VGATGYAPSKLSKGTAADDLDGNSFDLLWQRCLTLRVFGVEMEGDD